MYTSFFGLNEKPFSITPDPRYLFMSERHTEGLAHLLYGVNESGGFIQLTGEVGTGKTTLVRSLLQQLPEGADVALILNPQLSRIEFLSAICEELGVPLPAAQDSVKALTNALNAFLLSNHGRGRRTILIVDEAQNLRVDVLEQVRLLTNLETAKQKLLQIILIGQEELRDLLSRNDMRQLAQRITGRYHLEPLTREESTAYIDHRLRVAGAVGDIFGTAAKRELFRLSHGVPRVINVIADRALLGAFTQESRVVTPALVRGAADEVYGRGGARRGRWRRFGWPLAAALVLAMVGAAWLLMPAPKKTDPVAATASEPTAPPARASLPAIEDELMPAESAPVVELSNDELIDEPLIALGAMLTANAENTSTDRAFDTLFGLWNTDYAKGPQQACKQAEKYQLYCLFQRGSLSQVRSLDRPVILTLRDDSGTQHQVVLSGLGENYAVLNIKGEQFRVAVEELGDYWFGEYLLLWRPQIGVVKSFFPGMRDPDVRWIRKTLGTIQGEPALPVGSDMFDQGLEERVKDYQRERRLTVDGLVGHQTQIVMNTDLGAPDRPRLARVN
ncbi:MAG: ExeA family protein [Gammaproteobacteria bacterium]